jgi:hypothetical protein
MTKDVQQKVVAGLYKEGVKVTALRSLRGLLGKKCRTELPESRIWSGYYHSPQERIWEKKIRCTSWLPSCACVPKATWKEK